MWGPITPKWLGSYESELNDIVEEIASRAYETVIDVGCAEGFYAVGLAYRIPTARILAYDADFLSRRQTRKLASLNGLEGRVGVFRYCAFSDIARHATDNTLIVCDIEGFERSLLDPLLCPSLRDIDILVKSTKEVGVQAHSSFLKTRFSVSHAVKEIVATDRQNWIDRGGG